MQNRGTPDPNWIHLLFESWNLGQKWTLLISISCALPPRRVWTLPSDSYPPEQEHSFGSLFSPTMCHQVHFAVALHDQRCLLTAKHVRLTLSVKKTLNVAPDLDPNDCMDPNPSGFRFDTSGGPVKTSSRDPSPASYPPTMSCIMRCWARILLVQQQNSAHTHFFGLYCPEWIYQVMFTFWSCIELPTSAINKGSVVASHLT